MHTLSTLRFQSMNTALAMTILDDTGEALYALLPSTLLEGRSRYALLNSEGSYPIYLGGMFDGPTQEGPSEGVWYCVECGDGPIPDWNPCCSNCPYTRNSGGWTESPRHTHPHELPGSAQDGPSETVWYCDNCGDGPLQTWNPCCPSCGHTKCSYCNTQTN